MAVDLLRYVTPSTVCIFGESLTKPLLLEKIAEKVSFCTDNPVEFKYVILDGLQAREMLGSTALTRGLALPHCRISGISDFIIGIVTVPEGVAYGSLDGMLSRVFIYVVAPKESENEYLNIMAEIGDFLSVEGRVETLAKCKDDKELYETFRKFWEEHIKER